MTADAGADVEGEERFARTLAAVADNLDNLPKAAAVSGQAIVVRAAQLAPVNTGTLANSIRAAATGAGAIITAGAPYAVFQEYGTAVMAAHPYMRPAVDAAAGVITDAYTAEIQALLETVEGA